MISDKVYFFENLERKFTNKKELVEPKIFLPLDFDTSNETLNLPEIKVLLQSQETYDVVLLDTFYGQEALVGFGDKFKAPVVSLSSFGSNSVIDSLTGNPHPYAYVASHEEPLTNKMTLYDRFYNFISTTIELTYTYIFELPLKEALLKKHFINCTSSLTSLLSNVAVVLLNTQPEVNFPRPWLQNIVLVGGLHIPQNTTALPKVCSVRLK